MSNGLIAGCRHFGGDGDYVEPGIDRFWYSNNIFHLTISLWVRPEGEVMGTAFGALTNDVSAKARRLHIMRAGDKWELGFKGKTLKEHAFTSNEWQLLSMVVMATNKIYYYKNGIGSTGTVTLVPTNAFAPDYVPVIGRMAGTTVPDYNFRGLIDEFQVSAVARSSNWLWACWMNQGGSNGQFQGCQVMPVDDDHDLMADAWERQYFGDTNATNGGASEDPDGDGLDNLHEYIVGTDPTTNTSCLVIEVGKYGGNMAIIYDALKATGTAYSGLNRYYDLEECSNLPPNSWTPVMGQSNIWGDGSEKEFTNLPPGDLRRFYRVKARLRAQ